MDEEPLAFIRKTTRSALKVNRQVQKQELADVRRSIETLRITSASIADVANRLKNKNGVSLTELQALKNMLIQDEKNINIVLSNHGSLRGLTRELSGSDVKRQWAAAGCLCNLALGDSKACVAIAKAAGPYLVTALDNLSTELAVTCAWTLGNAAGAGPRPCEMLVAQGAVAKLVGLLACRDDRQGAAEYALQHFASQMKDEFSKAHIEAITEALSKLEFDMPTSQLLFTISSHHGFQHNQDLVVRLLDSIPVSAETHLNACTGPELCCNLTYLIRTLANLSTDKVNCDFVSNYVKEKQLIVYFKRISITDNVYVKESLFWFLGNLLNVCSDCSFINEIV